MQISSIKGEVSPRPELWDIRQMSFEFSYTDYYSTEWGNWQSKELIFTPFQWRMNSGDFIGYDWTRSQEQLFGPWTGSNLPRCVSA